MYARDNDNLFNKLDALVSQMEESRPKIKRRALKKGIDYSIQRAIGKQEGINVAFESPYGQALLNKERRDAQRLTRKVLIKQGMEGVDKISNRFKDSIASATRDNIISMLKKLRGNKGYQLDASGKVVRNEQGNPKHAMGKTGAGGYLIRSAVTGLPLAFVPNDTEFQKRYYHYLDRAKDIKHSPNQKVIGRYISEDFKTINDFRKKRMIVKEGTRTKKDEKGKIMKVHSPQLEEFHKENKERIMLRRTNPEEYARQRDEFMRTHNERYEDKRQHWLKKPDIKHFYIDPENPYEIKGTYDLGGAPEPVLISRIDTMPYKQIADDIMAKSPINTEAIRAEFESIFPDIREETPDIEREILKSHQSEAVKQLRKSLAKTIPPKEITFVRQTPESFAEGIEKKIAEVKQKMEVFPQLREEYKKTIARLNKQREEALEAEEGAPIKPLTTLTIEEMMQEVDNIAAEDEVDEEKEMEAAGVGKRV
jgi:hypothetical protein